MSRSSFIQDLFARLEGTGRGRQVMLLGGPRWGKTTTLLALRDLIYRQPRQWAVYGPCLANYLFTPEFYQALAEWLDVEGFLRETFSAHGIVSPLDFWQRVYAVADLRLLRRVVILVDEADLLRLGRENLAELVSAVRGFHTEWREFDLVVHFVWAGHILPSLLLEVYLGQDSASWPFERNQSLLWLPDLNTDELYVWLSALGPEASPRPIYSRYLYELTIGDVATTAKVLSKVSVRPITCAALAEAAEVVILDRAWGGELEHAVRALSPMACESVAVLLQGHLVRTQPYSDLEDELLLSGLTRLDDQPYSRLLRLRNWVVEATLRRQSARFSKWLGSDVFSDYTELIPPTYCLNQDTFALLCEIEHLLRNLARVRLGGSENSRHPFQGLNAEQNINEENEDQLQRSSVWKKRVVGSRWVNAHAALVSYTDTKDLLGLLDYLIAQKDPVVSRLKDMRGSLEGFKAIRDAVMHGQIITEDSLDNLIEIRRQLFAWLTVSK